MQGIVKVWCYSGYKGRQEPRSFKLGGSHYRVEEIVRRWREMKQGAGEMLDCYEVVAGGRSWILVWHTYSSKWTAGELD